MVEYDSRKCDDISLNLVANLREQELLDPNHQRKTQARMLKEEHSFQRTVAGQSIA